MTTVYVVKENDEIIAMFSTEEKAQDYIKGHNLLCKLNVYGDQYTIEPVELDPLPKVIEQDIVTYWRAFVFLKNEEYEVKQLYTTKSNLPSIGTQETYEGMGEIYKLGVASTISSEHCLEQIKLIYSKYVKATKSVKLEQLFIDYFPNLIISESKSYSIEGSYSKKTESNYYTLYIQYETKNNSWHSELSFAPFDSAFPLCQHSNLDTFMQETKAKLAALFLDMYNQIK